MQSISGSKIVYPGVATQSKEASRVVVLCAVSCERAEMMIYYFETL